MVSSTEAGKMGESSLRHVERAGWEDIRGVTSCRCWSFCPDLPHEPDLLLVHTASLRGPGHWSKTELRSQCPLSATYCDSAGAWKPRAQAQMGVMVKETCASSQNKSNSSLFKPSEWDSQSIAKHLESPFKILVSSHSEDTPHPSFFLKKCLWKTPPQP